MRSNLYRQLLRRFQPQRFEPGRRALLKATAAASAGALLANCQSTGDNWGLAASGGMSGIRRSVIVIGGGFSGLTCAYELASRGYDVLVLEARNRVGGRVVTFSENGKVVEGGGELIGSPEVHPMWHAYAARFGLTFNEIPDKEEQLYFEGKVLSDEAAKKLHEEMEAAAAKLNEAAATINENQPWLSPNAAAMDAMSMADWLGSLSSPAAVKHALRAWFEADETVSLERQSYLAFLTMVKGGGMEKFWSDVETCRCAQGNQALARKLAEHVRVKTSTPVASIAHGPSGVMVTTDDTTKYHADDVVLTLPPSLWRNLHFTPALPPALTVQMGVGVKYLSPVKGRYWEEAKKSSDSLSDTDLQMTWEATEGQAGDNGVVMTCFAGGPAAEHLRTRPRPDLRAYVANHLNTILPGYTENALEGGRFMDWPADPLTMASYSFAAPNQIMAVGPILHAGIDRLHFAGEHTCFKFCGYMEGALQSGAAAARRIAVRDGVARAE